MKDSKVKAKFTLGQLSGLFLTLATVGIVAVISISINSETANDMAECATNYTFDDTTRSCLNSTGGDATSPANSEWNASVDMTTSMTNVTSKMPTYGLVAGFALVLGVVFVLARQAQS